MTFNHKECILVLLAYPVFYKLLEGIIIMAKAKAVVKKADLKHKQSAVIKPGTGSGSRPHGGSTKTPMSDPSDQHGLHRKPKGSLA